MAQPDSDTAAGDDDTHVDSQVLPEQPDLPYPPWAKTAALLGCALLLGWWLRNWTLQNTPQPLPMGPVMANQVTLPAPTDAPTGASGLGASNNTGAAAYTGGSGSTGGSSYSAGKSGHGGKYGSHGSAAAAGPNAHQLEVQVGGAVVQPGIYDLPDGARVHDALTQAGGAADNGDIDGLDLAARLTDGQRIDVPVKAAPPTPGGAKDRDGTAPGTAPTPPAPAAAAAAPMAGHVAKRTADDLRQFPVVLNTATMAELAALPGVGPGMAAKIVAYRQQHPFATADDLLKVPGIGQARVQSLEPFVKAN